MVQYYAMQRDYIHQQSSKFEEGEVDENEETHRRYLPNIEIEVNELS